MGRIILNLFTALFNSNIIIILTYYNNTLLKIGKFTKLFQNGFHTKNYENIKSMIATINNLNIQTHMSSKRSFK